MTELPAPLTPADCDLRGLSFMPLHTARLLDSDLFALSTGDEFKAALALWCKAWLQVPAASLPDDDRVLAHLSGAGTKWRKVKGMALRGFVKCSDGRLYHPVIAAEAIDAMEHRTGFQEKKANKTERQKRWRERVKDVSEQLRALGVTPPMNASLTSLERLLKRTEDAKEADCSNHVDVYVDSLDRDRDNIPFTDVNGAAAKISDQSSPPQPPVGADPAKALWDDAKAYLGTGKSGQIGKWIKDHGLPAVRAALDVAKAENGGAGAENPVAFMAAVLRRGAEREAQRLSAERDERARFDRRFPERTMTESEARALMNDAEFARWQQRNREAA